MEDSKVTNASVAPVANHAHHGVTNYGQDQHQDKVADNNTSNHECRQEDAIEYEKSEPITQEITATKSQGAESLGKDYSIFGPWQKKFIVFAATMGAFFSPFSTQIYFPALTSIAKDLNVTNSKINLTVTTYMILQAIAPAFIGNLSDSAGRRPAFIICFIIYIAADIALALQNNYVALLILRMVQSGGSSGTVALANAVVADVATSAERGIYIGITSLAAILAPSLGPILGGIIAQYAGWKWIFWFLAILGGVFFVPMLLFMPETCRLIVGDGSVPPPKWNRSLTNYLNERRRLKEGLGPPDYAERDALARKRGPLRFPNPLETLVVATEKEGFLILFFAGIVYAGFYAVLSGMPSQLKEIYGFDDLKVGLMYLPLSGGSIVAAFMQGRLIDWSFAREAKKIGMEVKRRKEQDLSHFPIEKARLQVAAPVLLLATISTVIYGWILHFHVSVAGPIMMLFLQGFALIASTQCISILIVDINPGLAGTATAAFNLIRCLLGAAATALILPMTDAMGLGWSYTLIADVYVLLSPMLWVVVRWGPGWRRERTEKEKRKLKEKEEKDRKERDETDKTV
ncbi:MFS multidrug transporter-like protein [Stipitochalara longipes BDJ]|nr:MFS multidrug transporter-like protein [Stipitochalara longipes BDJ]